MLIFEKFFSLVENLNFWELDRVSISISALWTPILRKITVGIAWSWVTAGMSFLSTYSSTPSQCVCVVAESRGMDVLSMWAGQARDTWAALTLLS